MDLPLNNVRSLPLAVVCCWVWAGEVSLYLRHLLLLMIFKSLGTLRVQPRTSGSALWQAGIELGNAGSPLPILPLTIP